MDLSYDEGSLTVLDRQTGALLSTLTTSGRNPQFIQVHGESVWVVSTGATLFDTKTGTNTALEGGSLDRFELGTLLEAEGPSASLLLPNAYDDPRFGGFGSFAISPDGTMAYIGSGLAAILYKVDLVNMALIRGPENPIVVREHDLNDTLTVKTHPDGEILITSFNANTLYRLNPATDTWIDDPIQLGTETEVQGPIDIAIGGGNHPEVYVVMSLANAVSVWTPGTSQVEESLFVAGPIANRVVFGGAELYLVNSGANHVASIDLSTGTTSVLSAFPVGSNPWELAVHDDVGYVTLFQESAVVAFDRKSGDWLWYTRTP
jgi:streptogramin lyase